MLSVSNLKVPTHIAIIMDGNGRWAMQKNKYRTFGHKAGVKSVRRTIREAVKQKVKYLTLFAFSSENWSRPVQEVSMLMQLFTRALKKETPELHANGVRLNFIGDMSKFSNSMITRMNQVIALTANNNSMILTIAINYGGRWDILQASKKLAQAIASGDLPIAAVNENSISQFLSMSSIPNPDLLIRTGGEQRISNFLLWQMAYTELYFSDTLWPDFDEKSLQQALTDYAQRERRFGKTSTQLEKQP
ncbi:MAG: isoprenyl transferase [Proteobacteria bacterium]|nr:isoprenyl transferase [Pseudomonadota bacterium]